MQLITYKDKNTDQQVVGVLSSDGSKAEPLSSFGISAGSMIELIQQADMDTVRNISRRAEDKERTFSLEVSSLELLSPIPEPTQDVICLGLNYGEHAAEAADYSKEAFSSEKLHPVYFSKRVTRSQGTNQAIPAYPELTQRLDYEAELAVIIGKDAKNVPADKVSEYIFGYTVLNDVSARDLQTTHKQWYLGKSLDGFTPMGPAITTADEIAFPPKLQIRSYVNGELRQNDTTDHLIFGIDYIIAELSRGMTLQAGTIISTGTPKGVGMGFDPTRFLNHGDEVICEIEKIGRLINYID